ncbi:AP-1 complex subunit mu [Wickerhamomyces ciferrii]|uniref:AP-1 complex subunit mu n=1 Tax=Wickerhamomyces ciferrii (strain ATCC 14091 / BCRC 22168 / CBS 111 / JCM 3599 / NBRC 0793 / NRRL Y-1031 F-60-10) TaxID=1206466 RepID=K0K7V9_WICCF|nr:AP-1 complex subunit mu [Wickerhamomyces ciferrii]CCH40900.1 AP-1 complex subunit mu [Wickerhamomyces ciferrii]
MASVIHFCDIKGKSLLSRDYKGDIPSNAVEKFPFLLVESEDDPVSASPVLQFNGINYLYITHNNLYLLALTKSNNNVAQIFLFLHKIANVLTDYFKELEEESIRDNFVIIYELLDEMMDFGFPQITETKMLKEYITQKSFALERTKQSFGPPSALTNAVSWRSEGIMYKKNEAFLDVVESINMLINPQGKVLRSEILGKIRIKSHLSGMPDLRLGLNDKLNNNSKGVEMEDVKFHQCVRLSKFENEKIITFIPPDGEFELMSYRLSTPLKPLIWVDCKISKHSNSRIEIHAKVKAQIKKKSTANNVEIHIPIPEDADSPKFKYSNGSLKWVPEKSIIVWKIKQFQGGKEYAMKAELGLPSVSIDDSSFKVKRPIQVKFQIPYFTTSGIQVRYLRINEPKLQYQSYPWVRYITQSGDDYTIRLNE